VLAALAVPAALAAMAAMANHPDDSPRNLSEKELNNPAPYYVVWEVTRHCDQPCLHCGSRAGPKLNDELSTDEVLGVAQQLIDMGTREVALIGGEAYLRKDLAQIIAKLDRGGVRVVMQTGGRAFTRERALNYRKAGLFGLGVSIDGPEELHDRMRNNSGSSAAAWRALDYAKDVGMVATINTQVNGLNVDALADFAQRVYRSVATTWQVQLTVPMGQAADRPEWLLPPHRIIDVVETLSALQKQATEEYDGEGLMFNVVPNNNIGYFGPHEGLLRSWPGQDKAHFVGCNAGIAVMSIEADGLIKPCPSLPTKPYTAGNVRKTEIRELWNVSPEMRFSRDRDTSELWGRCKTCYYADTCKAGCSFMTHCLFGKRGNMPYCYYRASELKKQGLKERLVQVEKPPGEFYDFGRFEIVEEPWDAEPPREPKRLTVL